MSGNDFGPMSEDKMMAYIYDDVDDSDIFAFEALNTSLTETDPQDKLNSEHIDVKVSEILQENETLKDLVKTLKSDKDLLELRVSEVYKTAKAELERKDRRLQEAIDEKNNFLFRRNRNFKKNQPNNVTELSTVDPAKVTNEEFQVFHSKYKIPKKNNFDDIEGQDVKQSKVLPNLFEERSPQDIRFQNCKGHQYSKDIKNVFQNRRTDIFHRDFGECNQSKNNEQSRSKEQKHNTLNRRKSVCLEDSKQTCRSPSPRRVLTDEGSNTLSSRQCSLQHQSRSRIRSNIQLEEKSRTPSRSPHRVYPVHEARAKSRSLSREKDLGSFKDRKFRLVQNDKDEHKQENVNLDTETSDKESSSRPSNRVHQRRKSTSAVEVRDREAKENIKQDHEKPRRPPRTPPGSPPRCPNRYIRRRSLSKERHYDRRNDRIRLEQDTKEPYRKDSKHIEVKHEPVPRRKGDVITNKLSEPEHKPRQRIKSICATDVAELQLSSPPRSPTRDARRRSRSLSRERHYDRRKYIIKSEQDTKEPYIKDSKHIGVKQEPVPRRKGDVITNKLSELEHKPRQRIKSICSTDVAELQLSSPPRSPTRDARRRSISSSRERHYDRRKYIIKSEQDTKEPYRNDSQHIGVKQEPVPRSKGDVITNKLSETEYKPRQRLKSICATDVAELQLSSPPRSPTRDARRSRSSSRERHYDRRKGIIKSEQDTKEPYRKDYKHIGVKQEPVPRRKGDVITNKLSEPEHKPRQRIKSICATDVAELQLSSPPRSPTRDARRSRSLSRDRHYDRRKGIIKSEQDTKEPYRKDSKHIGVKQEPCPRRKGDIITNKLSETEYKPRQKLKSICATDVAELQLSSPPRSPTRGARRRSRSLSRERHYDRRTDLIRSEQDTKKTYGRNSKNMVVTEQKSDFKIKGVIIANKSSESEYKSHQRLKSLSAADVAELQLKENIMETNVNISEKHMNQTRKSNSPYKKCNIDKNSRTRSVNTEKGTCGRSRSNSRERDRKEYKSIDARFKDDRRGDSRKPNNGNPKFSRSSSRSPKRDHRGFILKTRSSSLDKNKRRFPSSPKKIQRGGKSQRVMKAEHLVKSSKSSSSERDSGRQDRHGNVIQQGYRDWQRQNQLKAEINNSKPGNISKLRENILRQSVDIDQKAIKDVRNKKNRRGNETDCSEDIRLRISRAGDGISCSDTSKDKEVKALQDKYGEDFELSKNYDSDVIYQMSEDELASLLEKRQEALLAEMMSSERDASCSENESKQNSKLVKGYDENPRKAHKKRMRKRKNKETDGHIVNMKSYEEMIQNLQQVNSALTKDVDVAIHKEEHQQDLNAVIDNKKSPVSSRRDSRDCSSSKDLKNTCAKEQKDVDALPMKQNKKKIDLDAYKKRNKVGLDEAQDNANFYIRSASEKDGDTICKSDTEEQVRGTSPNHVNIDIYDDKTKNKDNSPTLDTDLSLDNASVVQDKELNCNVNISDRNLKSPVLMQNNQEKDHTSKKEETATNIKPDKHINTNEKILVSHESEAEELVQKSGNIDKSVELPYEIIDEVVVDDNSDSKNEVISNKCTKSLANTVEYFPRDSKNDSVLVKRDMDTLGLESTPNTPEYSLVFKDKGDIAFGVSEEGCNDQNPSFNPEQETNHNSKDRSSFIHDFDISGDEEDFQNLPITETITNIEIPNVQSANVPKINILGDVTIRGARSPIKSSNVNQTYEQPSEKPHLNEVVIEPVCLTEENDKDGNSECIQQIKEAIEDNSFETEKAENVRQHEILNTEELQKCLEDEEPDTKLESKIPEIKSPVKSKNVQPRKGKNTDECAKKKKEPKNDNSNIKDEVKKANVKRNMMMFLFGSDTPSPSEISSAVIPKVKRNSQEVQNVKKKLLMENTSDKPVEATKAPEQPKTKTMRSKSVDKKLQQLSRKNEDLHKIEREKEKQSKSLNSEETQEQSKSCNRSNDDTQNKYPFFCNNPNYIPTCQGNDIIRKILQEYNMKPKPPEISEKQMDDSSNNDQEICTHKKSVEKDAGMETVQVNTTPDVILTSDDSDINININTGKKKKSKNSRIKIKMPFAKQSKKRKSLDVSEEGNQEKKKKTCHSSKRISNKDKVLSSDKDVSIEKNNENNIKSKIKSNLQKNKPKKSSKKKSKSKKSNEDECLPQELIETIQIEDSSSEKSKPQKVGKNLKKEPQKEANQESVKGLPEIGSNEPLPVENTTDTALRRGARVRKQVGFYVPNEAPLDDQVTIKNKTTPRRITPLRVGDLEVHKTADSFKCQGIESITSNKRKMNDSSEESRPEKLSKQTDESEKCKQSPLHNMEAMLKKYERNTNANDNNEASNLVHNPCGESLKPNIEIPVISVHDSVSLDKKVTVAVESNPHNQSVSDSSIPIINLDTNNDYLLGSFEQGLLGGNILENMSAYLLSDKSLLSNESPKTRQVKEGVVSQLDFSNCLLSNTNTSTPIRSAENVLKSDATRIPPTMKPKNISATIAESNDPPPDLVPSQPSMASGNTSRDKVSVSGMSSHLSNITNSTKSYLTTPLKRDRRKRVAIVMIEMT